MSEWVETELGACQLPDARHAKRLAQWFTRLRERPGHSMPRACHGWAEPVAASRFLDNPAMGEQAILSGPKQATLARIRAPAVVLLVQEPTVLKYGTTQRKPGMGTVKGKSREEDRRQPTVAFTPARVN
jgi:Transposase DNA-binding